MFKITIHHIHNLGPGIERWLGQSYRSLKSDLEKIMTAISDFADKMKAFMDRQNTAVADLQGDMKNLEDQIAALQNSPGQITPDDQALLDSIQARAAGVTDKLDALDALTPPLAPTV